MARNIRADYMRLLDENFSIINTALYRVSAARKGVKMTQLVENENEIEQLKKMKTGIGAGINSIPVNDDEARLEFLHNELKRFEARLTDADKTLLNRMKSAVA